MRKYTTLDPSRDQGKMQLVSLFLGQSPDDIQRKLQRLKAEERCDIEKFLEEAWRVFRNWNGIERWKLGELISTATIAELREERRGAKPFPPRKNSQNPRCQTRLGIHQCAICKKEGHWK